MNRISVPIALFILFLAPAAFSLGATDGAEEQLREILADVGENPATQPAPSSDFTVISCSNLHQMMVEVIQRHGSTLMFLICDGAGRPLAYGRDRTVLAIDFNHPARLLICKDANWIFRFAGGGTPEMKWAVLKGTDQIGAKVIWDPRSLATLSTEHAISVHHDPACLSYVVTTKNSRCVIGFLPAPPKGQIDTFDFQSHSLIGSAILLSEAIPKGLDLAKVNIDALVNSNTPLTEIHGDELLDVNLWDGGNVQVDKTILQAFSNALPLDACRTQWVLESESRRITNMKQITADIIGSDSVQLAKARAVFDEREQALRKCRAGLAQGTLNFGAVTKAIRESQEPSFALSSVLSPHDYISFANRSLSVPHLLECTPQGREIILATLKESSELALGESAQYIICKQCMISNRELDETDEDYFFLGTDFGTTKRKLAGLANDLSVGINKADLTPADWAELKGKWTEIVDKYKQGK